MHTRRHLVHLSLKKTQMFFFVDQFYPLKKDSTILKLHCLIQEHRLPAMEYKTAHKENQRLQHKIAAVLTTNPCPTLPGFVQRSTRLQLAKTPTFLPLTIRQRRLLFSELSEGISKSLQQFRGSISVLRKATTCSFHLRQESATPVIRSILDSSEYSQPFSSGFNWFVSLCHQFKLSNWDLTSQIQKTPLV